MKSSVDKKVIVVGGGLAGIACAVALESVGWGVTLIEARGSLGGRAGSFEDAATGKALDNCQHVLLGCCTNLLDLYGRMGVLGKIQWERRVHFMDGRGGGTKDLWGIRGVPAPLHLGVSMLGFGLLTVRERWAVSRAMVAMMRMGKGGREKLENVSFGEWLDEHQQLASLTKKFYEPVLISALNDECRRCSAKYAIQVFQDALLANERGYAVGLPGCPLGELYEKVPVGDVKVGTRVEEIVWEKGKSKKQKAEMGSVTQEGLRAAGVRLRGGQEIRVDAVVLATNHHAVSRWVEGMPGDVLERDGRFAELEKLESVPILGAHLWFDRPVVPADIAAVALIEGPLQWLFRKEADGKAVHGVISAAREWVNVPREEALKKFETQVHGLFALGREARLERGVIVIEKRATFSPVPGADAWRPEQGVPPGGIEGLYLAGDYTKTNWPATMEGAVRSGYLAAEAVSGARFLVGDLPVQWPARLMGLSR